MSCGLRARPVSGMVLSLRGYCTARGSASRWQPVCGWGGARGRKGGEKGSAWEEWAAQCARTVRQGIAVDEGHGTGALNLRVDSYSNCRPWRNRSSSVTSTRRAHARVGLLTCVVRYDTTSSRRAASRCIHTCTQKSRGGRLAAAFPAGAAPQSGERCGRVMLHTTHGPTAKHGAHRGGLHPSGTPDELAATGQLPCPRPQPSFCSCPSC